MACFACKRSGCPGFCCSPGFPPSQDITFGDQPTDTKARTRTFWRSAKFVFWHSLCCEFEESGVSWHFWSLRVPVFSGVAFVIFVTAGILSALRFFLV